MATQIYETANIRLIDGTEVYLTPLKIRYLREFMDEFAFLKLAKDDSESIARLAECSRIAMKQYYPSIKTIEQLEDSVDLKTMYKIIDIAAGIKMNSSNTEEQKDPAPEKQPSEESGSYWDNLDLAKLESEVFLLGIWKDYEELEMSLSMPELTSILNIKRDLDYQEKKFLAGMQGVDLDEQTGQKEDDPWEAMKARVFSKGQAKNSNDVIALQGQNAINAGFGIGLGLEYERLD
jgi:hypothetical protein